MKLFKKIDHPMYDTSAWCTIEQCVAKGDVIKADFKMKALKKDRVVILKLLETFAEEPKQVWDQIEWLDAPAGR